MSTATLPVAPSRRWLHVSAPAIISVATYLVLDIALARTVGRPDAFWSAEGYRTSLDALVLLRLGPIMFSGLIVWPVMRARGAGRLGAAIGVLATPIAFGIVSAIGALTFFPPAQALYYGTNPIVLGAIGSQVAMAGLGALIAAWRRSGWRTSPTRWWSWPAFVALVAGEGVLVACVMWNGGQHVFYVWIQIYRLLFPG
ncbi:MAG: hypothetical protein B7C55_12655 [Actinomycetales bacterium mxb001]|nr:MAG: hypothetical protein B7C55_12655 [Actinomycetales bacterium mxb001]